jgi:phosphoribosylformimino-5-aminoimidazole carboxamide ribotide isomerase
MIIYPAMDLMGGRVVRLAQGRFEDATLYEAAPAEAILAFQEAGAEWAHIVDLDGARAGEPRQHGLLCDIALSVDCALQVAGGFREEAHLNRVFDAGVDRVVIGSLAVKDPATVLGFFDRFGGDRLCLALDIKLVDDVPMVVTNGWTETSALSLWEVAERFPDARHILVTDVGRDGMMQGPNASLMAEIVRRLPDLEVQASGGVSSMDDLGDLQAAGAAGAIVGKALWEGKIDLRKAIDLAIA